MRALPPRKRLLGPVAGDPVIVKSIAQDYRLWARLPALVDAIVFLADPRKVTADDKIMAVVGRPVFPPGVCTGCGCSELDACMVPVEGDPSLVIGCDWFDQAHTRCTNCGPTPALATVAKARTS